MKVWFHFSHINQKSVGVCVCVHLTEAENSLFSLTDCRFSCVSEQIWLAEVSEEVRVDCRVMRQHLDCAALILDADVLNGAVCFLDVNNRF